MTQHFNLDTLQLKLQVGFAASVKVTSDDLRTKVRSPGVRGTVTNTARALTARTDATCPTINCTGSHAVKVRSLAPYLHVNHFFDRKVPRAYSIV